jgi:hypothetical protein
MSFSTPSSSIATLAQSSNIRSEFEILQKVSRLTLDEPQAPQSPRSPFQTPIIRKRKPSCVTPPRAQAFAQRPQDSNEKRTTNAPLPPMGLPPMLPSSPAMDACTSISREDNPFTRHRPLHSPFSGVSALNLDFIAAFQVEGEDGPVRPVLQRRTQLTPRTNAASELGDAFPDLEDDEAAPTRALKMRRRSPPFDAVNDITMQMNAL